jgi:hypothetical protein
MRVTEDDYETLHRACLIAWENGDDEHAVKLDKIARKMNAELTNATAIKSSPFGRMSGAAKWQDMPSCIPDAR